MPICSTFEARPDGVLRASAGGAATSGGAGMGASHYSLGPRHPLSTGTRRARGRPDTARTVVEPWRHRINTWRQGLKRLAARDASATARVRGLTGILEAVQSKIAHLATRSVRYLEAGAGRPVLLLHAFPLSAEQWLPQLARPPVGVRLVAPDLRGFGGSDPGVAMGGISHGHLRRGHAGVDGARRHAESDSRRPVDGRLCGAGDGAARRRRA